MVQIMVRIITVEKNLKISSIPLIGSMVLISQLSVARTEKVSSNDLPRPSVIGTTTSLYATRLPSERKLFFAKDRFWVFYGAEEDGNPEEPRIMLGTSLDGSSWTEPVIIRDGFWNAMYGNHGGAGFSVWLDGGEIHYCYGQYGPLHYRKGTLTDEGTILWAADEQLVDSRTTYHSGICVDSDGYPFIIYYTDRPSVTKSSTRNGEWTEEFTYLLTQRTGAWNMSIVPLTDNRIYAFYAVADRNIKGRLFDSLWEGEEDVSTSHLAGFSDSYSAVAVDNEIHLVLFTAYPFNVQYMKRDWDTGWGGETSLASGMPEDSSPALSFDSTKGDLYCFWQSAPEENHVYYRKFHDGSWANAVDWIDESDAGFPRNDQVMCSYRNYGGKICVIYETETSSPYNLKFHILPTSTSHKIKKWPLQ